MTTRKATKHKRTPSSLLLSPSLSLPLPLSLPPHSASCLAPGRVDTSRSGCRARARARIKCSGICSIFPLFEDTRFSVTALGLQVWLLVWLLALDSLDWWCYCRRYVRVFSTVLGTSARGVGSVCMQTIATVVLVSARGVGLQSARRRGVTKAWTWHGGGCTSVGKASVGTMVDVKGSQSRLCLDGAMYDDSLFYSLCFRV